MMPKTARRPSVITADSTREPRQPSLLEKKKNIGCSGTIRLNVTFARLFPLGEMPISQYRLKRMQIRRDDPCAIAAAGHCMPEAAAPLKNRMIIATGGIS
jgi:hypothetical protein